ncbi:hypothetical protein P5673_001481 [Acropora cervicornis]|uniref:Uncharacterized protein n=1 Tax=Acropora cervicornis TaxID=6130 RepID=A0AAD9VGN4_ACRCE|nr:hypothetical protein P5673_001481 [Acropora cervicornis]
MAAGSLRKKEEHSGPQYVRGVGGNLILHVTSVAAGCCREERHLKVLYISTHYGSV